jgi:putative oxidoreductase
MCSILERFGTVAGRILLGLIFLMSGIGKIRDWAGTIEYMKVTWMKDYAQAIPVLLGVAIFVEIVGAVLLITGFKARLGSFALIVFLVAASLTFHRFWDLEGPARMTEMVNFMKNVSILGGLLLVVSRGPGLCSIDNCRATPKE